MHPDDVAFLRQQISLFEGIRGIALDAGSKAGTNLNAVDSEFENFFKIFAIGDSTRNQDGNFDRFFTRDTGCEDLVVPR